EKNAETYAIENMASTQQMLMDPQTRWATNGKDASEALQKGMSIDPDNPRLYYLQAMSLFGTPAQFGRQGQSETGVRKIDSPVQIRTTKAVVPHLGSAAGGAGAGPMSIICWKWGRRSRPHYTNFNLWKI